MAYAFSALAASLPCETFKQAHPARWEHAGPGSYAMFDDPLKLASAGAAQAMVQVNGSAMWLLATANGDGNNDGNAMVNGDTDINIRNANVTKVRMKIIT